MRMHPSGRSFCRLLGLAAALVLAGFGVCSFGGSGPPDLPTGGSYRLCMTQIDVGQGDAILLDLPSGEHWLVDGGGDPSGRFDVGAYRLMPWLRRLGVDRLDRVLITHFDADHFGGLEAVVESLAVGGLWVPTRRGLGRRARDLLERAAARSVPVHVVDEGAAFPPPPVPALGGLLHPFPGWDIERDGREPSANDGSLVLRLQLGNVPFLLTGDIEAATESDLLQSGAALRAAVLKVPHHGSRTSSTQAFVEAVDPLLGSVGAGRDNRYGFPHASVRARYLRRGASLLWTGRHGSHRICTDGFGLRVERHEGGRWRGLRVWSPEDLSRWDRASRGGFGGPARKQSLDRASQGRGSVGLRNGHRTEGTARRPRPKREDPAEGHGKKEAGDLGSRVSTGSEASETAMKEPVVLLSDREWARRRKERQRLRAPWKLR